VNLSPVKFAWMHLWCTTEKGSTGTFMVRELPFCCVGSGQTVRDVVGKLEKDRGVGFGEAPLNARPATTILQRPVPPGVQSLKVFALHDTALKRRKPSSEATVLT
jgi:hypothetical protein